jgi:hypothetical protein
MRPPRARRPSAAARGIFPGRRAEEQTEGITMGFNAHAHDEMDVNAIPAPVSGEPQFINPLLGQLWVDNSVSPSPLRIFDGVRWPQVGWLYTDAQHRAAQDRATQDADSGRLALQAELRFTGKRLAAIEAGITRLQNTLDVFVEVLRDAGAVADPKVETFSETLGDGRLDP